MFGLGWMETTFAAFATLGFASVRQKYASRPSPAPVKQEPKLSLPVFTNPPVEATVPPRRTSPVQTRRHKFDSYQGSDRQVLIPAKAADALITFANGEGYTGYFAAEEVKAIWETACEMLDIEPMSWKLIGEALQSKKLKIGQTRLNMPQYLPVKQRTGRERATLYKIPRVRSIAGNLPGETVNRPESPDSCRQLAGTIATSLPGTSEFSNDYRRVA